MTFSLHSKMLNHPIVLNYVIPIFRYCPIHFNEINHRTWSTFIILKQKWPRSKYLCWNLETVFKGNEKKNFGVGKSSHFMSKVISICLYLINENYFIKVRWYFLFLLTDIFSLFSVIPFLLLSFRISVTKD